MQARSTQHATFTIERLLRATPAQVFAAWSQPAAKALWFAGPSGKWTEQLREQDFRVGGQEQLRGVFSGGPVSTFNATYHDIVTAERIVYAYDMHLDDKRISVSLATVEFMPEGTGTRLVITEQGAFLDGYDDADAREQGTQALMDNLEALLSQAVA